VHASPPSGSHSVADERVGEFVSGLAALLQASNQARAEDLAASALRPIAAGSGLSVTAGESAKAAGKRKAAPPSSEFAPATVGGCRCDAAPCSWGL